MTPFPPPLLGVDERDVLTCDLVISVKVEGVVAALESASRAGPEEEHHLRRGRLDNYLRYLSGVIWSLLHLDHRGGKSGEVA